MLLDLKPRSHALVGPTEETYFVEPLTAGRSSRTGTKSGTLIESGILRMASKLAQAQRLRAGWSGCGSSAISNLTAPFGSSGGTHGLPNSRPLPDKTAPRTADLPGALVSLKPFRPTQTVLALSVDNADADGRIGLIETPQE